MKFSIRAIFAVTTFAALLFAILFAFPDAIAAVTAMLLCPMVSAAMVAFAVYGRGAVRAYGIGAAAPTVFLTAFSSWIAAISLFDSSVVQWQEYLDSFAGDAFLCKATLVIAVLLAVIGGCTTLAVRWFLNPSC